MSVRVVTTGHISLTSLFFLTFACTTQVSTPIAAPPGATAATPVTRSVKTISVANPSFESPAVTATIAGAFSTTAPPTSWVRYGSINDGLRAVGVLNPNLTVMYVDAVPHGSNVGVVFLVDNGGDHSQFNNSPAGIEQTLAATLQLNCTYVLKTHVGNLANGGTPPAPFQFNGFPNYRIELLAGSTVIASDNNSLAPGEGRFLISTVTAAIGASHAQAGQPLKIRLINLNSAVGIEVNFDNVSLTREY